MMFTPPLLVMSFSATSYELHRQLVVFTNFVYFFCITVLRDDMFTCIRYGETIRCEKKQSTEQQQAGDNTIIYIEYCYLS